ncbi:MAG: exopolysaccharide biosynthesis protein, partial [Pseudobdellovibrionaceae bacterium]
LSTPFGILIGFVGLMSFLNRPPSLPRRWENKKLPSSTVLKIAESSERVFEKLAFILHPRWKQFFRGPFRMISALLLILNAILLALPLPIPFSNAMPAWVILFQALGHLEEDGLFVVLSYLQTAVCLIYFGALAFGISSGIEFLNL